MGAHRNPKRYCNSKFALPLSHEDSHRGTTTQCGHSFHNVKASVIIFPYSVHRLTCHRDHRYQVLSVSPPSMQSERHNAVSRKLRTAAEDRTDLRANQHAQPNTRRFASIFPLEVPEAVSADCGDATHEEQNYDDLSRSESVAALDKDTSTTRVPSVASVGESESSTFSAAQQIIACYRAVHGSGQAPEDATTESSEKGRSQVPDDQRSTYTLAASADSPSTMDMMWRPKPKVHMHHTDRQALMQAVRCLLARIGH